MLSAKLKEAAGNSADATLYVDDVFSTWLYTGNGSTQTITNGIDLSGKGGMVWIKLRSGAQQHNIYDSARAWDTGGELITNTTDAAQDLGSGYFSTSSTGFGLPTPVYNTNAATYASWTFRKAAKFFDVQTVTHTNGTANNIDLSVLGTVGMVIAKITTTTGAWTVWQRSLTASNNLKLNTTAAQSTTDAWLSVSGTTATLSASAPTGTYVIYAYAHDTSSTGIIQCGSFASGTSEVTLGWEPQWIMFKSTSTTGGWIMFDTMRGWVNSPDVGGTQLLQANTSGAEGATGLVTFQPTATGFKYSLADNYIYMAIRRPNKPPTTGTQVYNAVLATSGGAPWFKTNIVTDAGFVGSKSGDGGSPFLCSRLTGTGYMQTFNTNAEASIAAAKFDYMNGWNSNSTSYPDYIDWAFKRAPGFFDVVCYTGTGVATTQAHNLTVAPELMIVKKRDAAGDWQVYNGIVGNGSNYLKLNLTDAQSTNNAIWNGTAPTSSVFSIGVNSNVNAFGSTYVAYLFATLAGISKVGSYTGNGSSQNIDCGFAAGARFFLVKATSTTGSWWVWDSARGIVAGNDPTLQLNSTAAEITTADAVDPYAAGITVNQEATCSINASGVSYIYLAIA